jgi:hypothetical protein
MGMRGVQRIHKQRKRTASKASPRPRRRNPEKREDSFALSEWMQAYHRIVKRRGLPCIIKPEQVATELDFMRKLRGKE